MYGIVAAIQRFDVAVGVLEGLAEPLVDGRGDELRRLAQQVEAGTVEDLEPVRARVHGDVAQHELGVQPVAAFFEVTAVRHLREHVGGAEELSDQAVARIVHAQQVERHLVAGEVHDAGRDRHPVAMPASGRYLLRYLALRVTWLRVNTAPFATADSLASRM